MHGMHTPADEAPTLPLNDPARHGVHADAPAMLYDPAGHVEHLNTPSGSLLYVPAAHGVHADAPPADCHLLPGPHSTHADAAVAPVTVLHVRSGQLVHGEEEPSGEP